MKRKEGWSCIFVKRIDEGKIYLNMNQEHGYMSPFEHTKKSMSGDKCGTKGDGHTIRKIYEAVATAIVYNQDIANSPHGLVVAYYERSGPVIYERRIETYQDDGWLGQKRLKNTTGWLIYISPDLELYRIAEDGRSIGQKLEDEEKEKIRSCEKLMKEKRINDDKITKFTKIHDEALKEHPDIIPYLLDKIDKDGRILIKVEDFENLLNIPKVDMSSNLLSGIEGTLSAFGIESTQKIGKEISPNTGKNYVLLQLTRKTRKLHKKGDLFVSETDKYISKCRKESVHEGMNGEQVKDAVRKCEQRYKRDQAKKDNMLTTMSSTDVDI